jgi:hypothetical protein
MSLDRCVVRFSEEELRSLDDLLRFSGDELPSPGKPSALRAGSLDELRGKGVPRASLVRAAVRALLDGEIAAEVIVRHLRDIKRTKRAGNKRSPLPPGALSVRRRVLAALEAHPGEVFASARLASLVGGLPDTVRNALLALSEQGHVEKLGPGQYRARAQVDAQPDVQTDAQPHVQTDAQTDAQPHVQTDAQPHVQSDARPAGVAVAA